MIKRRRTRQQYIVLAILLSIICIALNSFFVSSVKAQTKAAPPLHIANPEHVTIIILDMSISMNSSDPAGLRCSAADAYIDLSNPGDLVGVIGLNNTDNSHENGPRTFQKAQLWQQPTQMNTPADQHQLQQDIVEHSHHCQASGSTPTYDALSQALSMLTAATMGEQFPGSVILLTGGIPTPETDNQIAAIKSDLLPQFKQHSWPIDTIALGRTTGFHGFLNDLVNGTSGKFYDDGNGVVVGVSPLNTAPFFVDIYKRHSGRSVGPNIGPTQLDKITNQYPFSVSDSIDYLDVIVVKDQPETTVTLTSPSPRNLTLPPAVAGTYVSVDNPYYAVFSVQGPSPGDWLLNIKGSGMFIMDSLLYSTVKVTMTVPKPDTTVFPLGAPLTISADVTNQGIYMGNLNVNAKVIYAGSVARGSTSQEYDTQLNDKASSGTYQGHVTVPETAPSGSYEIVISASDISSAAPIASDHHIIRFELLPAPFFLFAQTKRPTVGPASYSFMRWDPVLLWLFSPPIDLNHWWFEHNLVQPLVSIPFQVQLYGNLYQRATVTARVTAAGSNRPVSVNIANDKKGFFRLLFAPDIAVGTYSVTFNTRGTFADSHGDIETTVRMIHISRPILLQPELQIWLQFVAPYLLALLFIILLLRHLMIPHPFGICWESDSNSHMTAQYNFPNARYRRLRWFFGSHILKSKKVIAQNTSISMPLGLKFRFQWGHAIKVRPYGKPGKRWRRRDGKRLRRMFQKAYELEYHSETGSKFIFTIHPRPTNSRSQQ